MNRYMKVLDNNFNFNYYFRCQVMKIIYFSFADDLLFFVRGDLMSVQLFNEIFSKFLSVISLKVNLVKSYVFFGGVFKEDKVFILQSLGYVEDYQSVRYLGVFFFFKKLNVFQYKFFVEKIIDRISFWSVRMVFYAGRV